MRIALIAMSGVRVRTRKLAELGVTLPGFVRRGKVIASLPSLGLLTVAGLTPSKHELTYHEIDQGGPGLPDADLVGIPLRVTVGAKGLEKGCVELRWRREGKTVEIPVGEAAAQIHALVTEALRS